MRDKSGFSLKSEIVINYRQFEGNLDSASRRVHEPDRT